MRLLELQRDTDAFWKEFRLVLVQLEALAEAGRIEGYDVASALWSAKDGGDDEAASIPLQKMLALELPNLKGIHLPVNVLETWGLDVAAEAAASGLEVHAVRPHLAVLESGIWSLSDSGSRAPPQGYQEASAAILERFNFTLEDEENASDEEKELAEGCRWMRQLVNDMHRKLQFFTSPQHFEQEFLQTIMPLIDQKFSGIDEESLEILMKFFTTYGEMVTFYTGERTRQLLTSGALRVTVDSADPAQASEECLTFHRAGDGRLPLGHAQDREGRESGLVQPELGEATASHYDRLCGSCNRARPKLGRADYFAAGRVRKPVQPRPCPVRKTGRPLPPIASACQAHRYSKPSSPRYSIAMRRSRPRLMLFRDFPSVSASKQTCEAGLGGSGRCASGSPSTQFSST
eukprot:scaffold1690_cov247-Pinguiococcus_pyrenoidosus.AAC.8